MPILLTPHLKPFWINIDPFLRKPYLIIILAFAYQDIKLQEQKTDEMYEKILKRLESAK